jgi:hypothetical protein
VKFVWLTAAAVCIIGAAVFAGRLDFDKAFIVAAVGIVCWFLNYREQMKEVVRAADEKNEEEDSTED